MVSDSDTSWLRDPSDYLAQHPSADWFISTDCLSAEVGWVVSRSGAGLRVSMVRALF